MSLILSILLLFGSATPTGSPEKRGMVDWSESRKLIWEDFGGPIERFSPHAATTFWKIGYTADFKDGELNMRVFCQFNQRKSWVKNGHRKPHILAHEQIHFDIAEWYARKLQKEFEKVPANPKTIQRDIDRLFNKVYEECVDMQEKFDTECDHGLKYDAQEKWGKRVVKELGALSEYAIR